MISSTPLASNAGSPTGRRCSTPIRTRRSSTSRPRSREWRGAAFAEFADAEWIQPEAIRLDELRVVATEARIDAELRIGQHEQVVGELEALLVDHPLRERFAAQLMLALYRSGRQAEALRAAHDFGDRLRDEFGLEPSAALRDLESRDPRGARRAHVGAAGGRAIAASTRRRRGPDSRRSVPAETHAARRPRARPRARGAAVRVGRILTLFGPGGVGKTRLVHRLATTVEAEFPDGIRLVELAPVRDQSAVAAAVGDALDVQQRANRSLPDSIVEMLASRHLLLVLDNCEHVLDTTSELVELILRWCPNVQVLATSREPLGIPAEVVWSVPPLPVPADRADPVATLAEIPAVQLFVERARAARHDFELDDANRGRGRGDLHPARRGAARARARGGAHAFDEPRAARGATPRALPRAGRARAERPIPATGTCAISCSGRTSCSPSREQRLFERLVDLRRIVRSRSRRARVRRATASTRSTSPACSQRSSTSRWSPRNASGAGQPLPPARDAARVRARASRRRDRSRPRSATRTPRVHVELAEQAGVGLGGPDEARWVRELDASFDDMREAHASAHRRRRRRPRAAPRRRASRVRVAAHPLRAAGVGRRGRRASRARRITRCTRSRSASSPTAGSFAASSTPRSKPASGPSPRPTRLGAPTMGLAERAIGNAHFYRDRPDEADAWADRMIAAAIALDTPGARRARVLHAIGGGDVTGQQRGRRRARPAVDERGDASRAARPRTRRPRTRSACRSRRAIPRRHCACSTAACSTPKRSTTVGSARSRSRRASGSAPSPASRSEALRGYHDVIDTWFRGGDWANQWLSLRHVFAIFESLEHDEVRGDASRRARRRGRDARAPHRDRAPPTSSSRAVDRLTKRLGASEFADAAERGRAMRDEEVVRYALAAITAATNPTSPNRRESRPICVPSHAGSTTRASSVVVRSGTGARDAVGVGAAGGEVAEHDDRADERRGGREQHAAVHARHERLVDLGDELRLQRRPGTCLSVAIPSAVLRFCFAWTTRSALTGSFAAVERVADAAAVHRQHHAADDRDTERAADLAGRVVHRRADAGLRPRAASP